MITNTKNMNEELTNMIIEIPVTFTGKGYVNIESINMDDALEKWDKIKLDGKGVDYIVKDIQFQLSANQLFTGIW